MKQKVFTINDFNFKPHAMVKGGVQGMLNLPNGITVSIVGGGDEPHRLYGDGIDTFEVAAWYGDNNAWITLGDNSDVLTYVTKDKIPFILLDLSQKKSNKEETI